MKNKNKILSDILSTEPGEHLSTEELISDYEFYNKIMRMNSPIEMDELDYEPGFLADHHSGYLEN